MRDLAPNVTVTVSSHLTQIIIIIIIAFTSASCPSVTVPTFSHRIKHREVSKDGAL
jgi:hypothetical protein